MKHFIYSLLLLLPLLGQGQAVNNPRVKIRACPTCSQVLYEAISDTPKGTYPATEAGRKQFQTDIKNGLWNLTLDNGALIPKGMKPPVVPPVPTGMTGPSWASLRYTMTGEELYVEGAGSELARLRFQRSDGTKITGTNPNGVVLDDQSFFGFGNNSDATYTKQWRATFSPSIIGKNFKITAQKSDGALYVKEFVPVASANKAQLYLAAGSGTVTPPTTSTTTVAYDQSLESEGATLSNSGQDVFTFDDGGSSGGKIACCFTSASTYIDYTLPGIPGPGILTLELRYQTNTADLATASISSGGQTQSLNLSGTSGGKATNTISVKVTAGSNTIRIAGASGTFLQDKIRLSGSISVVGSTTGNTGGGGNGNVTAQYPSYTIGGMLGNSITTYRASTVPGDWPYNNAMAVDAPKYDNAHITEAALQTVNPNFRLYLMGQGSGLEQGYNASDADAVKNNITNIKYELSQSFPNGVQFNPFIYSFGGENTGGSYDETKLRSMFDQVFANVPRPAGGKVIMRTSFYKGKDQTDAFVRKYCAEKGYDYVDLSDVQERSDLMASEYASQNAGWAKHPNRAGHAIIANRFLDKLKTTSSGGGTVTPPAGALAGPGTTATYSDWNAKGANYYGGSAFRTAPSSVPSNPRSSFDYPVPTTNMGWPSDQNSKVMGDHRKAAVGPIIRLDNGGSVSAEIRLRYGGGVAVIDKSSGYQGINWPDHGRQAELTWYGGPRDWSVKYGGQWFGIGYDPIGVGNVGEIGSPVQAMNYVTGNDGKQYLYIKSQLLNWPSGYAKADGSGTWPDEITGCWLERWIRTEGDKVFVKARLTHDNPDRTHYGGFNQEWPNFMVNGSNKQVAFVTASGNPGTGSITYSDLIEQGKNDSQYQADHGVPRTFQQTAFHVSEPWQAANLRGKWWGIISQDYYRASNIGYKVWGGGAPGEDTGDDEAGKPATYLSAQVMLEASPDATYYTDYTIMVNSDLNQIRSAANALPLEALDYKFESGKGNNMWYCAQGHQTSTINASAGWDLVLGEYNQDKGGVTAEFASINSPVRRWMASGISTVYVKMAYTGNRSQLQFTWLSNGQNQNNMDPNRPNEGAARFPNGSAVGKNSITFNVTGDGQMRTYAIPVSSSGDWRNVIQQVSIKGFVTPNEPIRLQYVGVTNPN